MDDQSSERVLEYQCPQSRSWRRPDVLFGRLAVWSFALQVLLFTAFAITPTVELAILAVAALVLWPVSVTLAILGLVFDRRRQWLSIMMLVASIFGPVLFLSIGWMVSRLIRS